MSSLLPPASKLWWNEPIHKSGLLWITLVFVWGMVMTFMMPYWHVVGKQNLSNETYKTTPKAFQASAETGSPRPKLRMPTSPRPPTTPSGAVAPRACAASSTTAAPAA